tara:strand:- start:201 stop:1157 length:957 start_codon:yes stop_codon:yes gene_type:complete
MKKFSLAILLALFSFTAYAQPKATKPTIMIVPSDVWCNQNGFMTTYDNQGSIVKVPDYKRALQSDPTLLQVISQINGMMQERGFPLENLESTLKDLEKNDAYDNASEADGDGTASNLVDELKKVAKADIWMQITYTVNSSGFDKSIQFNLQGLDAYTNKQIATATGNGEPSSGSVPELMEEAVLAHLDNFCSTLMDFFDDMLENGREVVLKIKVRDDWGEDLYTEDYGDDELMVLIEDYVYDHTQNHVYNLSSSGDYSMTFKQCRIPLFIIDKRGKEKANTAKGFGKQIKNKLKAIGVPSRYGPQDGLGTVTLIIGEK